MAEEKTEDVIEELDDERVLPVEVTEKEGIMSKIKSKRKWIIAGAAAIGAVVLVKVGRALGHKDGDEDYDDDGFDDDFDSSVIDSPTDSVDES